MRTHTIAGLIFSAILISCAGIFGADTIELPFDYFYGRWTTGHFLDGRVAFSDADPQGRTDYSYTSDRNRIGLDDIREYLVVSQQSDYGLGTPWLYYYFRPASNWQIGLDALRYTEYYTKDYLFMPRTTVTRHLQVNASSHWMSKTAHNVPKNLGAFVYRFQPVLVRGQATMSNHIEIHHAKNSLNNIGRLTTEPCYCVVGLYSVDRNERLWSWALENSLRWGIGGELSLTLNIDVQLTVRDIDRRVSEDSLYSSDSYIVRHGSFERGWEPDYLVGALYSGLNPVYLELGVGQGYWLSDKKLYADTIDCQSGLMATTAEQSFGFQESQTTAYLNAYYLTRGEFDPEVILDDYNGFYRNMLFHNQFQAAVKSRYQKVGTAGVINDEFESLELSAAYGRWNKVEVGVAGSYERELYPGWSLPTRETVRTEVIVKYRSYTYRPKEGPGWSRDDRYDILFGVTPQFGQVYIEAKYTPPIYKGYYRDEVGFLAFRNLEKGAQSQLDVETSFGLGREFVLTSSHVVKYLHGSLSNHRFAFNLRRRVRNVELSLQYEEIYVNSGFDDTTIIGRLRILL